MVHSTLLPIQTLFHPIFSPLIILYICSSLSHLLPLLPPRAPNRVREINPAVLKVRPFIVTFTVATDKGCCRKKTNGEEADDKESSFGGKGSNGEEAEEGGVNKKKRRSKSVETYKIYIIKENTGILCAIMLDTKEVVYLLLDQLQLLRLL